MKIRKVEIKRYRSIVDLRLDLNPQNNFITICGANNTGKTNVLRAVNLFFNPSEYIASEDSPNHKFHGSRGAKVYPEITIHLIDKDERLYVVKRSFGISGLDSTTGNYKDKGSTVKNEIEEKGLHKLIEGIAFFFIPSINISFPELINKLIEDVYDLEYSKSRFRGLKQELKDSFETYIKGVVNVLNDLANEINPTFQEFNENWNVGFEFGSDVTKFRDLISNDIEFYLNDKSNRNIEGKGSGLQRLGYILLHSRIIKKITKKQTILLIDEPDVYLHQGLQRKLKDYLYKLSEKTQVFITSHSPVFIDSYKLENVFLLDLDIGDAQTYQRINKEFHVLSTMNVNLNDFDGLKKIQDYLGIKSDDFELLDPYNVMVEGDSDKIYIEETCNYFNLECPKIIPSHGVTKFEKYLEFYNSFHEERDYCPTICLLFDNDNAGRNEFKKLHKRIKKRGFPNLNIKTLFITNCYGDQPSDEDVLSDKINSNYEIEDFIYPEIICRNANLILKKRSFKTVRFSSIKSKITAASFKEKGILYNFDLVKNEMNPSNGHVIDFNSEQVKQGLGNLYSLRGNKKLSEKMIDFDLSYPSVKKFLQQLCDSEKMCK